MTITVSLLYTGTTTRDALADAMQPTRQTAGNRIPHGDARLLMRQRERVAELRRHPPQGAPVGDYQFEEGPRDLTVMRLCAPCVLASYSPSPIAR